MLHLLAFVRSVIAVFPVVDQKNICQICLRIQALGSRMVRIHALKTINEFLRGVVRNAQKIAVNQIKNDADDELDLDELRDRVSEFRLQGIPVELVAKLIVALRDIRPGAGDQNICQAWLEVCYSTCFTISASDTPREILQYLPQVNNIDNTFRL